MPDIAEDQVVAPNPQWLETASGLLTKLGIPEERVKTYDATKARARLINRISSQGVPEKLKRDEKKLIEGLGFTVESQTQPEEEKPEEAETYVLVREDGQKMKKELLTPSVAKAKNEARQARKDKSHWVPESEVTELQPKTLTRSEKTEQKIAEKVEIGSKKVKKQRDQGPVAAIRKLFNSRKRVSKQEYIDTVLTAGGTKSTALTYYSMLHKIPEWFGINYKLTKEGRNGDLVRVEET